MQSGVSPTVTDPMAMWTAILMAVSTAVIVIIAFITALCRRYSWLYYDLTQKEEARKHTDRLDAPYLIGMADKLHKARTELHRQTRYAGFANQSGLPSRMRDLDLEREHQRLEESKGSHTVRLNALIDIERLLGQVEEEYRARADVVSIRVAQDKD
jgi:hypothetical protein